MGFIHVLPNRGQFIDPPLNHPLRLFKTYMTSYVKHFSWCVQMQLDEQNRLVMEMEASLESQARELDNRLTEQQQQYESEINSLLQKISEKENSDTKDTQQFIK